MTQAQSKHPLLLLAAFVLAGGVYGRLTSLIPAPNDMSVFWLGNLCAPWLVLSFFAGRAQASWRVSVLAGVLTDVACVGGFYLSFLTLDPFRLGLPASTPLATVALTSLAHWLNFVAPWGLAALAGGAAYGALGHLWRRSRLLAAGLALAAPFIAEPALWPLSDGRYQGPWFLWAAEVVVGFAVAGRVLLLWRRQPGRLTGEKQLV